MKNMKERFMTVGKKGAACLTLAAWMAGGGGMGLAAQNTASVKKTERQVVTVQSKFFCNTKALTPEERARHKQLGEKLTAARKETVEVPTGYEFQFSPKNITIAELAEWVAAESKCCPFFDFHLDLEAKGSLLCLRLTGEEGIKTFIRTEFAIP